MSEERSDSKKSIKKRIYVRKESDLESWER